MKVFSLYNCILSCFTIFFLASGCDRQSDEQRLDVDNSVSSITLENACVNECVWGNNWSCWGMGGQTVEGTCASNQICCDLGGPLKTPCAYDCIKEWDACNGTLISQQDGYCSDIQQVCCNEEANDTDSDTETDTEMDFSVWPNAWSRANSDPLLVQHHSEIQVMRPRILALNFVNRRTMEKMEDDFLEMIDILAEASRYKGYADEKAPAFLEYQLAYQIDLRDSSPPVDWPYRNSTLYPREDPQEGSFAFDYEQLFTQNFADLMGIEDPQGSGRNLTMCELIDLGEVHEIWIYGDADVPDVNAAEILELKPVYDTNRNRTDAPMERCAGNGCFDIEDDIPCTRTVRVAWYNNTRGKGCFLESLSHGVERTASVSRPVPYISEYFSHFSNSGLDKRYGLPYNSWYDVCHAEECFSYPSETSITYNVNGYSGTIDNYDPVCGNAHFMPNTKGNYDLYSDATVLSSCYHYRDGSGQLEPFSIDQFSKYSTLISDCMGPWLVWWRQNFPGLNNTSIDDNGNPMLNWWPFLYY